MQPAITTTGRRFPKLAVAVVLLTQSLHAFAQATTDTDGDGIADTVDNCPLTANANQRDTDGDGLGSLCDADLNNDGVVNLQDYGLFRQRFGTADPNADFNGSGLVTNSDFGIFRSLLNAPQINPIPDSSNSAYAYEVSVPLSIRGDGGAFTISATVADATVADAVIDVPSRTLLLRPNARGQTAVKVEVRDSRYVDATSFNFTVQDVTRTTQVVSAVAGTEAVVLTNHGPTVTDFDLTHNGHLAFSSMDKLLETIRALPDAISAEPLPRKIWRFVRDSTYHFRTMSFEQWLLASGPTLNSFGFGLCSNVASVVVQIAQAAGFEARARNLNGHVVPEIRVAGAWQMYDPDLSVYYYKADGAVAGVDELIADPSLISSPINPIFSPGVNDVVYSQTIADIYGSTDYFFALDYLPTNSLLNGRITLPAGGRLIYPGVWSPPPVAYDDYFIVAYPVEQFRQARLELPAGFLGSLPIPWVLADVQGTGRVRIGEVEYDAGSTLLRDYFAGATAAVTSVDVIDNPSGLALIMLINPLWYDMRVDNNVLLTGKDVWAVSAGSYALEPANRPPPEVPATLRKPRE
jgi:hypothetical protein